MSMTGTHTYREIGLQAKAIEAAWKQVQVQQDWIQRFLGGSASYEEVVFIGSGSSYYQAQVMAATYRRWTGRSASALPSSELFLFRDSHVPASVKQVLAVGVSRSGESTEVLLALESVSRLEGWDVCGITCYEESSMAKLAPCLVSPLGKEESTVMTQSFSSMTFLMQAAIASAAGHSAALGELEQVVRASAGVVARAEEVVRDWLPKQALNKTIYLGMGAYIGLAHEACLKLKEMSCVWTESFGTLEFRHGPKSVVEPGTLVVLLLSEGARDYELKVAQEMKAYGATVLVLTAERRADADFADEVFEVGGAELSDEARSVLYMPLLQYLGYYTAVGKGLDPDHPRNLTQVVRI